MDRFNVKPGRGRRTIAVLLLALAILQAIKGPLSARFFAAGSLLMAYELAFVPSPPLNARLSDIYAMARQGWRMSWPTKIRGAALFVLMVTSTYLQFHGR